LQPPVVRTETKTITYESSAFTQLNSNHNNNSNEDDNADQAWANDAAAQLVSSQIISSETESTITTTEITKVGCDLLFEMWCSVIKRVFFCKMISM